MANTPLRVEYKPLSLPKQLGEQQLTVSDGKRTLRLLTKGLNSPHPLYSVGCSHCEGEDFLVPIEDLLAEGESWLQCPTCDWELHGDNGGHVALESSSREDGLAMTMEHWFRATLHLSDWESILATNGLLQNWQDYRKTRSELLEKLTREFYPLHVTARDAFEASSTGKQEAVAEELTKLNREYSREI